MRYFTPFAVALPTLHQAAALFAHGKVVELDGDKMEANVFWDGPASPGFPQHFVLVQPILTGWDWDPVLGVQPQDEHVRAYRYATQGALLCDVCGEVHKHPISICNAMVDAIDADLNRENAL